MIEEIRLLRAENEMLRQQRDNADRVIVEIRQQRDDADHVIVENGINSDDLNRCGCELCMRVKAGMEAAGFI